MLLRSLLEKYFAGASSPEETEQVLDYLADDQADVTPLQDVMDAYDVAGTDNIPARDLLLTQLRLRLYPHLIDDLDHTITAAPEAPVVALSPAAKRNRWWIAAAAVLVAVSASGLWWMQLRRPQEPAWTSIDNRGSQLLHQLLPDGSQVWLQPHSRLSYVANMQDVNRRDLKLDGECFFDVAHDALRPFTVEAAGIRTLVLGTAFNIEAYAHESNVRISLVRGKVSVSDSLKHMVLLTAGHLLVYDRLLQQCKRDSLGAGQPWTDGTLVMHNIPVKDALLRVANRFGMSLNYAPNIDLKEKFVDGAFKDQSLEEMLRIILFVSGYHFRIDGTTIHIY